MKKLLTLAAVGVLGASALTAQAQITVDGKVSASEIGTGLNHYQLVSTYAGTHSAGTLGLQSLYIGESATKLYIMVVGAAETADNYPGIVVYLNVPGKTGVPAGTQLKGGADGQSPLKHTPTMDFETDYGFRVTTSPANMTPAYFSFVDYTNGNTAQVPDSYQGEGVKTGTAHNGTATSGPFMGARYSYLSSANVTAATAAGSGFEVELDKTALGIVDGNAVNVMAAYVKDGGAFTSDVLPQVVGQLTDLGSSADFNTLAGKQYATYIVGTGVQASRAEVARTLGFGVYPNPAREAKIVYTVNGRQDVALEVVNLLGQRVRSLSSAKQAGRQEYQLSDLQAGTYLVKLRVGDQLTSQKVIIN
ncbi:T9SS type A sorting domain-containing protein [Hymenobacter sp. BT730]|uniref:T9SS type A sorting domain-containing protein n=1 Tax=Hymenobacter sp. BT730 TaxID=3063332 RepID=UPI0026E07AA3|nr:T9SS type A sorting domain-containing protein [Hymenobacter sp. BT730]